MNKVVSENLFLKKGFVMNILEWKEPSGDDSEFIYHLTGCSRCMSSDSSYVNLFLLREKYNIEISFYKNFLLRRYNKTGSRLGYCFPIGSGDLKEVLQILHQDALEHNRPFTFCLLSQMQKDQLSNYKPNRFLYKENRNDSDYIYLQSSLALLSGKEYHKKRNHLSKFNRKYPTSYYKSITKETFDDVWEVAVQWFRERFSKEDPTSNAEMVSLKEALLYFEQLRLKGCILYADDKPVAMTIASPVSETTCDVHFEKAFGSYATNGAYTAINQHFASTIPEYTYINREEDIGLPGLRSAKLSYHPDILLSKYHAIETEELCLVN